jgi:hypothetical protein
MPFVSLIVVKVPVATGKILIKIVARFSSNLAIVCFNCEDQTRLEFNVCLLNQRETCVSHGEFDAALLF